MEGKTWNQVGESKEWRAKAYYDIGELAKDHKKYKNESETTIFREWDSGGNALIADQKATNIRMLKTAGTTFSNLAWKIKSLETKMEHKFSGEYPPAFTIRLHASVFRLGVRRQELMARCSNYWIPRPRWFLCMGKPTKKRLFIRQLLVLTLCHFSLTSKTLCEQ